MVSYGGENGDVYSYNDPISTVTKEAIVKASEMVLRGRVGLVAISRSVTDSASFGRATKFVVQNLLTSAYRKHEAQVLYGREGFATLASVAAQVTAGGVITIPVAQWSAGIWSGSEGMKLTLHNFTDDCSEIQQAVVTSVDFDAKKITATVAVAGQSADWNAVQASLTAGDEIRLYEYGSIVVGNAPGAVDLALASNHKAMLGIHAMLSATSGSVFNVPVTYSLWKPNQKNIAGALTFKGISKGLSGAVAKGVDGKVSVFVSPEVWAELLDEQTTKREFDSSYDRAEYVNGAESIKFYSQNGVIEIISSTFVKNGYAYALDLSCFKRVGSSEITMKIPGTNDEHMLIRQDEGALEFRTFCDTAVFCSALGKNVLFYGITIS